MTYEEAVKWALYQAEKIPSLVWYVVPFGDKYIVHSKTHMDRHPSLKFEYSTIHLYCRIKRNGNK